ncbi:thiolase family protein [Thermovenabulum gondwanense]|uniref:Acetyl-CoA acetyltransferase n=1 Tax=Thermovenabulum gondwanense TaxID=520767 RepID=A0A162M872_9FIRM|nr:thiolase family protein [Thermovenabulum gondwanense]KYO64507.1 Acetyl-CoA acetyltransferase [Thermovenabulum gondwanense]
MREVVILSAVRTACGKFGGSLSEKSPVELGSEVIKEAVKRAGIEKNMVEEVIWGNAWQAGVGPNLGRLVAVKSGLPVDVSAFSINKRCASGLKAIALAVQAIKAGDADCIIAGGTEMASRAPYLLPGARWGYRLGAGEIQDHLHQDGFMCPLAGMMMGATAEVLVEKYGITRREQDEYAFLSHKRAIEAIDKGKFKEEIIPINIGNKKNPNLYFETEEIPRRDISLEALSKLPPVFRENGTITAGTSSALCDGAAALVLMDKEKAKALGLKPLAKILSHGQRGIDPVLMGLGPVKAVPIAVEKAGLTLKDIDLIELNEAFAGQVIAVMRELGLDIEKTNIYGGAISLGHPIGATGAKLLTTLIHALKNENKTFGMVTLCVGGGQGEAMIIERLD